MAPLFSEMDDDILVEEVANHPSLWQLSHSLYKDQRVKDNIWIEIANKVGKPIDQCKKRWRNIKDTHDRKKNKKTGSAATPPKKGKKWALEEKLSFLRTAEEHRGSFSSMNPILEEEVNSPLPGDEEISQTQTSTPTQTSTTKPTELPIPPLYNISSQHPSSTCKRKRPNNREQITYNLEKRDAERNKILSALLVQETEDDVDLFFKSLAKYVKKLTPALQQRAKAETLNVITKLETEMWKPMEYVSYNTTCINNQQFCSDSSASISTYSDVGSSHQNSITEITSFSELPEHFCHVIREEEL